MEKFVAQPEESQEKPENKPAEKQEEFTFDDGFGDSETGENIVSDEDFEKAMAIADRVIEVFKDDHPKKDNSVGVYNKASVLTLEEFSGDSFNMFLDLVVRELARHNLISEEYLLAVEKKRSVAFSDFDSSSPLHKRSAAANEKFHRKRLGNNFE